MTDNNFFFPHPIAYLYINLLFISRRNCIALFVYIVYFIILFFVLWHNCPRFW